MTNYNRNRYYTPRVEGNGRMVEEIFQLRKQVEELTEERDRLRGSLALFEAENARLEKLYNGIYDYVRSIEGEL